MPTRVDCELICEMITLQGQDGVLSLFPCTLHSSHMHVGTVGVVGCIIHCIRHH